MLKRDGRYRYVREARPLSREEGGLLKHLSRHVTGAPPIPPNRIAIDAAQFPVVVSEDRKPGLFMS